MTEDEHRFASLEEAAVQVASWSAASMRSTARWTKWLAFATVLLAIGTTLFAAGSYVAQRDGAREAKRQTCLAELSLETQIAELQNPGPSGRVNLSDIINDGRKAC